MAARSFMRGNRRLSSRGGFLLTETLATFTISAFVLIGLVSASSVLWRAVNRSVALVQDVDDLDRTLAAIGRDVSSLTRARWNGDEPQRFVFRGGPNSLFFASVLRGPEGVRDTSVVALREINVGRGTRLMRADARLSARAAGFDDLRFGPQRELGTGAARLRFYYVARADGKSDRPRLREWPMGFKLPAAVIVEAVDRKSGRVLVSSTVPIHINADIGCLANAKSGSAVEGALAVPSPARVGAGTPTPAPTALPSPTVPDAANAAAPRLDDEGRFCERSEEVKKGEAGGQSRQEPPKPMGPTP